VISNVSNLPISLVKRAHSLIKDKVKSGGIVIDATVGNGHDTLFLLELVGSNGKVFGFDIQEAAIASTKAILQNCPIDECVTLLQCSHAEMIGSIPASYHGNISGVMFNLGYLPGGDKRITTQTDSTLLALASACRLLAMDGIITILAYPGHEGGKVETDDVKNWCFALHPGQFQVKLFEGRPDNATAPRLFAVTKVR
jgi:hypothetical protein